MKEILEILDELETWLHKEVESSGRLVNDVLLGKHHQGMIAGYNRTLRVIAQIKERINGME